MTGKAIPAMDPLPDGPPRHPGSPHIDVIEPRSALTQIIYMTFGIIAALALIFMLPQNRYIQYQQSGDSILFHAKWLYERVKFDRSPIEVAVVGTSRLEAGISPNELASRLKYDLGKPVPVANLSLVESGRDLHYSTLKFLFAEHPEVKMVVLSLDGDAAASHPLFKFVADDVDIIKAPIVLNAKYFPNLFYLPYRHLTNSAQELFPWAFEVQPNFSPKSYLGTTLDRTEGYRTPGGDAVNGEQSLPAADLYQYSSGVARAHLGSIPGKGWLSADQRLATERSFVRKISTLCRAHGVKIVFLRLPMYRLMEPVGDLPFYQRIGTVLQPSQLGEDPKLYANGAHLNRDGAVRASDWLADAVAPELK